MHSPASLKENVALAAAWLASLTLGQWQQIVGIATGILVGVYTLMRMYYLRRDRKDRE